MDGYINSSVEQQMIYDIYRACRLCGAGAGYKMPIMQNVVHLDSSEVELKQKIRDCVQIEVHQEDKMPPLICELCVDKVNDFYEFLEMCRQTNKRTRLRLGLPPQTMPRGAPDAGDCILGVTEPVYLNEYSNESLLRPRDRSTGRFKKETGVKKNKSKEKESRSLRSRPSSPPCLRGNKRLREDDVVLSSLQVNSRRRSVTTPKSILRKENEIKIEEWSSTRSKRTRDSKDSNKQQPTKRVKIVVENKSRPAKLEHKCASCKAQFSSGRALHKHARTHDAPAKNKSSLRKSCSKCKRDFQSKSLLDKHKCTATVTNKCVNCGRIVNNTRNLAVHEKACLSKKGFKISPKLRKQLKPVQIRVERCDALLERRLGDGYDVSTVHWLNFGLDSRCSYPYLKGRIKKEPGYMVAIHDSMDDLDYVHWDSDPSDSDPDNEDAKDARVETLATLTLKTIFSHKFLGKVPRKRRRTKKPFDSDRLGIENLIDSLGNDNDTGCNDKKDDNDSLFGDNDKTPAVCNDDFDSLFNSSDASVNDMKSNDVCDTVSKDEEDYDKSENKNDKSNDSLNVVDINELKNAQDVNKTSEVSETVVNKIAEEIEKVVLVNDSKDKTKQESEEKTERTGDVTENNDFKNDAEKLPEAQQSDNCDESNTLVNTKDTFDCKDNSGVNESGDNHKKINDSDHVNHLLSNDTQDNDCSDAIKKDNDTEDEDQLLNNDTQANDCSEASRKDNDTEDEDQLLSNDTKGNDSQSNDIGDTDVEDNVTPANDTKAVHQKLCNDSQSCDSGDNSFDNDTHLNYSGDEEISNDNGDVKGINDLHTNDCEDVKINNDTEINESDVGDGKGLAMDDIEDVSGPEMDDKSLMEAIDEQIGEKRTEDMKIQECDRDSVTTIKSADLESVSSIEFANE